MKILTENERASLLTKLNEAPDDILLEAVARLKDYYVNVKDDMKSLNGFVGIRFTEAPKVALPTEPLKAIDLKQEEDKPEAKKVNRAPPGPSAARITTASKDSILTALSVQPIALEEVNRCIGRTAGKLLETRALLSLMWDRHLITFDGTNYGVKK